MQSQKKTTRTQRPTKNGKVRLIGHFHEDSALAHLFTVLSEGKEVKIEGLSEILSKGTTGSLRGLKRDPNSCGKWTLVRRNRGVRLSIRRRKPRSVRNARATAKKELSAEAGTKAQNP